MRHLHRKLFATVAALGLVTGCSKAAQDDGQSGASGISRDAYEFDLTGDYEVIDAMGVALTSTSLVNRDRTTANEDNHNKYQNAAPFVAGYLLTFRHFLSKMHGAWAAQLRATGFEPCSDEIPVIDVTAVIPCTIQKLRRNATPEGPRVLDVVIPDWVTLSVDKPLGFPNGRILDEQVTDAVLAMGFLKMGGKCPGDTSNKAEKDANGVPICNIETFRNMSLNPPKNDRAFSSTFPYLARPWFYDAVKDQEYWPLTARKSTPE